MTGIEARRGGRPRDRPREQRAWRRLRCGRSRCRNGRVDPHSRHKHSREDVRYRLWVLQGEQTPEQNALPVPGDLMFGSIQANLPKNGPLFGSSADDLMTGRNGARTNCLSCLEGLHYWIWVYWFILLASTGYKTVETWILVCMVGPTEPLPVLSIERRFP